MKAEEKHALSLRPVWLNFLSICLSYRLKMPVSEVMVFPCAFGETVYYVCPRCKITMEREFMAFCDRCGQHLDWRGYKKAKILHPGSNRTYS